MEPSENSESTLYLDVCQCKHLPASSWSVAFIYQFCALNNYKIVQVDTQKNCSPSCGSNVTDGWCQMRLPPSMTSFSSAMRWSELPEIVKGCDLPAVVDARGFVCYTGLCTVLRRLVMSADAQDPSRNLISLLGFRQTSLKTCSEVSPWTKLCEVQAPTDLARLLQECSTKAAQVTGLPEAIQILETSLSNPVTTFNAVYRQQKLKKKSGAGNTETGDQKDKDSNNGPSLKAAYKSAAIITDKRKYKQSIYGERTKEGDILMNQGVECMKEDLERQTDVAIPMAQLDLSEDSNSKSDTTSNSSKTVSDSNRTKSGQQNNTPRYGEEEAFQNIPETTEAKKKSKLCTNKNAQSSLPTLEHTFAEGPDLTLTDVALFPYIQFFVWYTHERRCTNVLRTIPFVLRWCRTMQDVPGMVETSVECGLRIAKLPGDICDDSMTLAKAEQRGDSQEAEFGKGKSRKAVKAAVKRELPGILEKLQSHGLKVKFDDKLVNTELDWNSFHKDVNPCQDVDEKRAKNKRSQVESLVAGVKMLAKKSCKIVDFCSGGGHVGIVLAYLLPDCHVVMIENNEESLRRAVDRVSNIGLKNVTLYQSNIDYFSGEFDIGVSLHACGVATDLVLSKCLHHQAAFVSSPCCYGGLQDTHLITYPRSQEYKSAGITCDEHFIVGHAAEQTSWNFDTEHSKRGKSCMGIIDHDRALAAQHQGYQVYLCSLLPSTCSPKNNLLIGWHKESPLSSLHIA